MSFPFLAMEAIVNPSPCFVFAIKDLLTACQKPYSAAKSVLLIKVWLLIETSNILSPIFFQVQ